MRSPTALGELDTPVPNAFRSNAAVIWCARAASADDQDPYEADDDLEGAVDVNATDDPESRSDKRHPRGNGMGPTVSSCPCTGSFPDAGSGVCAGAVIIVGTDTKSSAGVGVAGIDELDSVEAWAPADTGADVEPVDGANGTERLVGARGNDVAVGSTC